MSQPNNPLLVMFEDLLSRILEVLAYPKSEVAEQQSLILDAVDEESAQQPWICWPWRYVV